RPGPSAPRRCAGSRGRSRVALRRGLVAGEPGRLDVTVGRRHPGAVLGQDLADPAEDAVAGDLVGQLPGAEVLHELVGPLGGDPVEVAAVDLPAGRLGAARKSVV